MAPQITLFLVLAIFCTVVFVILADMTKIMKLQRVAYYILNTWLILFIGYAIYFFYTNFKTFLSWLN